MNTRTGALVVTAPIISLFNGRQPVQYMQQNLIAQGLELLLYGMGTVGVFLTLLVIATTLMSRIVSRYFPEPVPVDAGAGASPVPDARQVAVITAAISRHRQNRKTTAN